MVIKALVRRQEKYLLALRNDFHMHPELSMMERQTADRIRKELQQAGISSVAVGETGTVGVLRFSRPGRKIALRAEIDALPVQEEIDWACRSTTAGVMHACGHDAHTATLLAAARCLAELRDELSGTVYFCFEPGEETAGGGAEAIVEYLRSVGGVDEVVANHMTADQPAGTGVVRAGIFNAGNCHWRITVTGRSGHGSRPDQAVNPIPIAARIIERLLQIPSNHHDPFEPIVISPCTIHAGSAFNAIPGTCVVEGNLRYFRKETIRELLEQMDRVARGVAAIERADATMERVSAMPPVINDSTIAQRCRTVMEHMRIPVIVPERPIMASDDFALFLDAFPGCYVNFGGRSDRADASCNPHNSRFFLDEKGFLPVTEFFVRYAAERLR